MSKIKGGTKATDTNDAESERLLCQYAKVAELESATGLFFQELKGVRSLAALARCTELESLSFRKGVVPSVKNCASDRLPWLPEKSPPP